MSVAAGLRPDAPTVAATQRPWARAVAWLAFLGPFFFASYGFATWWTGQRGDVGSLVFGWERRIPFVPWTIVPYWSIDVLYGISLFLCATRAELDRHALRLFTAQLVSVAGFLLFPLRFSLARPEVGGVYGALFAVLGSFDKPFNQAPSLHVSLLVILWSAYALKTPRSWRWLVHAAFALIGVSVLTTWQHHFIDIPTGLAVGMLCLWLWPTDREPPLRRFAITRDARRQRIAIRYALGSVVLAAMGGVLGGAWLWLCWGTLSLALVATFYAALGGHAFQKRDGRMSLGGSALLLPYLVGAWVNSRMWTRRDPRRVHVDDGVFIGRVPARGELDAQSEIAIVDVCAELPVHHAARDYAHVAVLDLTVPDAAALATAAAAITRFRTDGPVLVCCALGYSRSACAVAAWLLVSGRTDSVEGAIARLRDAHPKVVLTHEHEAVLRAVARTHAVAP